MRAAQYVRMSTDHQQYSIENQIAAIAVYAARRGFDVVKTYSDPAKSGLDLAHRPGLRQLLQDVASHTQAFEMILVYDVSRWGRFQDADESAYWEFVCKIAGIRVHYCAESFLNDGSPFDSLLKTLKRTMAAEYSRELSAKVFAAQCRIAQRGYKLGGIAGYGLNRLLLDSKGQPKGILKLGEQKNLAAEKVTYIAGTDKEVQLVREIYRMFIDEDMTVAAIARDLNCRGILRDVPGPWMHRHVMTILSHPKYAGCIVFNQCSVKLRSKKVRNPRDQWIIRPASFEPIIRPERFEAARQKLDQRTISKSDEQILEELRSFAKTRGRLSVALVRTSECLPSPNAIRARFGSFTGAYRLIQYEPPRSLAWVERQKCLLDLRASIQNEFLAELSRVGVRVSKSRQIYKLHNYGDVVLKIARHVTLRNGGLRWDIQAPHKSRGCLCVAIRLNQENNVVKDYVLFDSLPEQTLFRFGEMNCQCSRVIATLRGTVEAITAEP